MARRRSGGLAEGLLDIFSRLPWWVGVITAVVTYVLLHPVAEQVVPLKTQPGWVGAMAVQTIWKTLASVGQYLVPALALVGAGLSAWRQRQRQLLVTDVAQSRATGVLDGMSWQAFEMLVGEGFRQQGYQVTETGGGGADGGVDLVLAQGSEKFFVQCKQWRAMKVGVEVVRELYGVMAARGASGGFVVTSGRFTEDATQFARGRNVQLIDGPKLQALIRQGKASPARADKPQAGRSAPGAMGESRTELDSPTCPLCSKPMVRRLAKQGPNAGGVFWGCSGYPA